MKNLTDVSIKNKNLRNSYNDREISHAENIFLNQSEAFATDILQLPI